MLTLYSTRNTYGKTLGEHVLRCILAAMALISSLGFASPDRRHPVLLACWLCLMESFLNSFAKSKDLRGNQAAVTAVETAYLLALRDLLFAQQGDSEVSTS